MNKEIRLLYLLEQVDDSLITEAAAVRHSRRHLRKRWLLLAACLGLLLALSLAAYATNLLGLRSLLLPLVPETVFPAKESHAVISLTGYQGSPEYQALAEWQAFLSTCEENEALSSVADGRWDASLLRYSIYLVYSREKADKMEEITAKYGLKLHTTSFDLQQPEYRQLLGAFAEETKGYYYYLYEDGTFQMEGTVTFDDIGAWDFQLLRAVRGTFHDTLMEIGDIHAYQEEVYQTIYGLPVTLALGKEQLLLLADLTDSMVTVQISYGADSGLTMTHAQYLADSLPLDRLTPVHPVEIPQVQEQETRSVYAAVLRNLLYNAILPDGEIAPFPAGEQSQFAVCDVDGDGKEELVLCYDAGVMAGMKGYVLGYDSDTQEVVIQLEAFPAFVFLTNGSLKVLSSHQQWWGEMDAYLLYHYLPDSDSYQLCGYVSSEDRRIFAENGVEDRYPIAADTSNTGTVYYIGEESWGTIPCDITEYLSWLQERQGNSTEQEIVYKSLSEEQILALESVFAGQD